MPPLEHFAHSFLESVRPEPELLARADVILADVQGMGGAEFLPVLAGGRRAGAELIVLAGEEQIPAIAGGAI